MSTSLLPSPAMPFDARHITCLLVAVEAEAHTAAMLDVAAELAAELHGQLRALFIQDEELLRLAELPMATEIVTSSGERRPLIPGIMKRTWQVQAEALRRALAERAEQLKLDWSFTVVQDTLWRACRAPQAQTDLLLLGRSRRTAARRPRGGNSHLAVLCDGSAESHRAFDLAVQLAKLWRLTVQPLLVGTPEQRAAERSWLLTESVHLGPSPLLRSVAIRTPAELRTYLREHAPRLLLVGRSSPWLERTALQSLLGILEGPLGIVA